MILALSSQVISKVPVISWFEAYRETETVAYRYVFESLACTHDSHPFNLAVPVINLTSWLNLARGLVEVDFAEDDPKVGP